MKLLLLGKNSYPAEFYLNENKENTSNINIYNKKFENKDILDLDNKSFFIKYFSGTDNNFDCSLNFIHIHEANFNLEIKINSELSKKLIYAFNEMKIVKNIYLSSVNAYKEATTSYGKAKYICEEIYRLSENSIIVRPSTIIDIDFDKKLILGGKKGKSLNSLNSIIQRSYLIPVPGNGKYLQTICFGSDLGKFLSFIIISNIFDNKTINFFSGEMISYNEFLNLNFKLKKIKRIKLFIPIFLIFSVLKILNSIFSFKISPKNIENLINQKIEFDHTDEIIKHMNLKKINNDF